MKYNFRTTQLIYEYIINQYESIFTIDSIQNNFRDFSNDSIRKALSTLKKDGIIFGTGSGVYINCDIKEFKDFIFFFEKIKHINVPYLKSLSYIKTPEYLLFNKKLTNQIPSLDFIIINKIGNLESSSLVKIRNILKLFFKDSNLTNYYTFIEDKQYFKNIVKKFFIAINQLTTVNKLDEVIKIFNGEYDEYFYISDRKNDQSINLLEILYSHISVKKYNELHSCGAEKLFLNFRDM